MRCRITPLVVAAVAVLGLSACGEPGSAGAGSGSTGTDRGVTGSAPSTGAPIDQEKLRAAAEPLFRSKYGTDLADVSVFATTSGAYGALVGSEYPEDVPVVMLVKIGDFEALDASIPSGVTQLPTGRTAIVVLNEDGSLLGSSLMVEDLSSRIREDFGQPDLVLAS